MFLESLGIPFAAILLPLTAGSLIITGKTSFWVILLVSTSGLVLGSLTSYYLGFLGSNLGRHFIHHKPKNNQGENSFLERYMRYGGISVFFAQLFGTTRTWISMPAGAAHMNLLQFLAYTTLGGILYCTLAIGSSLLLTGFLAKLVGEITSLTHLILFSAAFFLIAGAVIYILRRKKASDKLTS